MPASPVPPSPSPPPATSPSSPRASGGEAGFDIMLTPTPIPCYVVRRLELVFLRLLILALLQLVLQKMIPQHHRDDLLTVLRRHVDRANDFRVLGLTCLMSSSK